MNIGNRIRERRKDLKLTQAQVGDYFGITSVSVSEWERSESKPEQDRLPALARLLKTTVASLLDPSERPTIVDEAHQTQSAEFGSWGTPPPDIKDLKIGFTATPLRRATDSDNDNAETVLTRGRLPLISWVQAGQWGETIDNFHPHDAEEWIPCPFNHSDEAFILRVVGLSMYNPGGDKSYAPGEYIAVDPHGEAMNRKMVVARIDDEDKATFKQLLIDPEGTMILQALNPEYRPRAQEMPKGSRIVGTVIGKWVAE